MSISENLGTNGVDRSWQSRMISSSERLVSLYNSKRMSDLALTFPGHDIVLKAHRIVLAMSSPVFEEMLFGSSVEKRTLSLSEDPPEAFSVLLQYIYCDTIELLDVPMALQVLVLARKYHIEYLAAVCSQYLRRNLNPKNMPEVYNVACLLNDTELLSTCLSPPFDPKVPSFAQMVSNQPPGKLSWLSTHSQSADTSDAVLSSKISSLSLGSPSHHRCDNDADSGLESRSPLHHTPDEEDSRSNRLTLDAEITSGVHLSNLNSTIKSEDTVSSSSRFCECPSQSPPPPPSSPRPPVHFLISRDRPMQHSLEDFKRRLLRCVDGDLNVTDVPRCVNILRRLKRVTVTTETLASTRIVKLVNQIRKASNHPEISRRGKTLVRRWKMEVLPDGNRAFGPGPGLMSGQMYDHPHSYPLASSLDMHIISETRKTLARVGKSISVEGRKLAQQNESHAQLGKTLTRKGKMLIKLGKTLSALSNTY